MEQQILNLLDIQRNHFISFLKFSLQIELQTRQICIHTPYFEVTFYSSNACFESLVRTYKKTINFGGNYSTRLIILRSFYSRRSLKINFEWIILGNLPLLRRQRNFFVNGTARVSITQIIRSPGIYTNVKLKRYGKKFFYLDLVPERGIWVRLERDPNGYILLRIRKEPRLPIWLRFKTIGVSFFYIAQDDAKKTKFIFKHYFFLEKFLSFFFANKIQFNFLKKRLLYVTYNYFKIKTGKLVY